MLDVVEQQEPTAPRKMSDQGVRELPPRLLLHLERLSDGREKQGGIADWRKRDPDKAVRKFLRGLSGGLQGESRLPRSARPAQRQQPDVFPLQERNDLAQLLFAPQKRRRRHGQIRVVQRPELGELFVAQLPEPLGCSKVLQAVLAQIPQ